MLSGALVDFASIPKYIFVRVNIYLYKVNYFNETFQTEHIAQEAALNKNSSSNSHQGVISLRN